MTDGLGDDDGRDGSKPGKYRSRREEGKSAGWVVQGLTRLIRAKMGRTARPTQRRGQARGTISTNGPQSVGQSISRSSLHKRSWHRRGSRRTRASQPSPDFVPTVANRDVNSRNEKFEKNELRSPRLNSGEGGRESRVSKRRRGLPPLKRDERTDRDPLPSQARQRSCGRQTPTIRRC